MNKHKLVNIFSVITLILFMGLFLFAIVNENKTESFSYFIGFILLVITFSAIRISDGIKDEVFLLKTFGLTL